MVLCSLLITVKRERTRALKATFRRADPRVRGGKVEITGNFEAALTKEQLPFVDACAFVCQRVRTSMQLGNNCVGDQPPGSLDNWFPLTSLSRLPLKRCSRTANWHRVYSLPIFPCFALFFPRPSFVQLRSSCTRRGRLTRTLDER